MGATSIVLFVDAHPRSESVHVARAQIYLEKRALRIAAANTSEPTETYRSRRFHQGPTPRASCHRWRTLGICTTAKMLSNRI